MIVKNTALKRDMLVYLPIVLGPIILFSPILCTGKSLYWGIPALQFIPWRFEAWKSLSAGSLPFWNSLNGMGAPLIANYQLALFYPPGWILYLFQAIGGTPWMAWAHTLLTIAHLIWAGLGMVRLMKRLGFGQRGKVISGLSFSLCGYLVARASFFSMVWAGAWLPWIMESASKIAVPIWKKNLTGQSRFPLELIIYIGMLLLSGHAQLSWYILTLATAWVLVGAWLNGGFRTLLPGVSQWTGAVFFGAALAAIQLIPTAEYLLHSQRASAVDFETAMSYSFWPWRFLTLFAPDFFGNPGVGDYWGYGNFWEDAVYIGILPLLLALISLTGLFQKKKNEFHIYKPLLIFCWAVIFLAIVFGMGKNTPIFPFLYANIPTFDMFNAPTRYMIWMEFGLTLLAGVAAEMFWQRPDGKLLYWVRLATAGAAAVTIGAFLAWKLMGDVSPTFIRSTAIAGLWGLGAGLLTLFMPDDKPFKPTRTRWLVLVILLVGADLLYASWQITPAVDRSYFRTNGITSSSMEELIKEDQRLYLGAQEEYEIRYDRFLRFYDFNPIEDLFNMRRVVLPNLNLLDGISTVNNFDPFVPDRFATVINYVDTLPDRSKENWLRWMNVGQWERIDKNEPLGVDFKHIEAEGRFRWINCAQPAEKPLEAFNLLKRRLDVEGVEVSDQVVLENSELLHDAECSSVINSITMLNWMQTGPGRYKVDILAEANGYLLFAETGYPGWKARLDEASIDIYPADYLFQAVAVPAGAHRVEFVYQPQSFYFGLGLSGFSLLFLIIWAKKKWWNIFD